ncbi:MAG: hypothetical protein ACFCUO_04425 [Rhodospirillales bacterium]
MSQHSSRFAAAATAAVVVLALPLFVAITGSPALAETTYVTGCINGNDVIRNVAIGTKPSVSCRQGWPQITWEVVDPLAPPPPSPNATGPTVGFYVTLANGDPDTSLATNGPLEFFARCTVEGTSTTVQVFATSSEDGWFSSMGGPHAAGEQLLHYSLVSRRDGPEYADHALRFDSSIASPDGHFLAVGNETMALGTRVFGHDCLVVGVATAITGRP